MDNADHENLKFLQKIRDQIKVSHDNAPWAMGGYWRQELARIDSKIRKLKDKMEEEE